MKKGRNVKRKRADSDDSDDGNNRTTKRRRDQRNHIESDDAADSDVDGDDADSTYEPPHSHSPEIPATPTWKKMAPKKETRKSHLNKVRSHEPKRVLASFVYFANHHRPRVIKDNPALAAKFPVVQKILGDEWKSFTAEEKAPWRAMVEEEKVRFAREKQLFEVYGQQWVWVAASTMRDSPGGRWQGFKNEDNGRGSRVRKPERIDIVRPGDPNSLDPRKIYGKIYGFENDGERDRGRSNEDYPAKAPRRQNRSSVKKKKKPSRIAKIINQMENMDKEIKGLQKQNGIIIEEPLSENTAPNSPHDPRTEVASEITSSPSQSPGSSNGGEVQESLSPCSDNSSCDDEEIAKAQRSSSFAGKTLPGKRCIQRHYTSFEEEEDTKEEDLEEDIKKKYLKQEYLEKEEFEKETLKEEDSTGKILKAEYDDNLAQHHVSIRGEFESSSLLIKSEPSLGSIPSPEAEDADLAVLAEEERRELDIGDIRF